MTKPNRIYGTAAMAPRITKAGAVLMAIALSVPVFVVLGLVDLFLL